MAQTDEKIRTINLEPIGLGKVRVEDASKAAANIYNELANLGKGDSETSIEIEEPAKPTFNTGKLKTYGMYIGGGIAAVYLIGKALE